MTDDPRCSGLVYVFAVEAGDAEKPSQEGLPVAVLSSRVVEREWQFAAGSGRTRFVWTTRDLMAAMADLAAAGGGVVGKWGKA